MSYHGFGQIAPTRTLTTTSTTKPVVSSQEPVDFTQIKITLPSDQPVMPTPTPDQPTTTISHRAPPALPPNYSAEAMGCLGKTAVPIRPGRPGYPGFICVDLPKVTAAEATQAFVNTATGGSGGGTGMVSAGDMQTVQTAGGMNMAIPSKSEAAPGAPATDTQQPSGTVTPESFAAACKQVSGAMGTPNCCKLPNGVKMGLQGGSLVQVTQCNVAAAGGLGGNLPLIAGAAVVALLLARGL